MTKRMARVSIPLGFMAAPPWQIRPRLLVLIASAFVLSACGSDSASVQTNAAETSSSELFAECGGVVFPTMPPDPEALPPLDAEIGQVFEDFITGPLSVESSFIAGNDMRIAEQTDSDLVLLGIGDDGYVNARFEWRDGEWTPTGWGGCSITVSAPGFGPADTIFDPEFEPDPTSTALHLWIQERNCASGQPPTDREVVPVIVESTTRIEITTLVEPVSGGADCPSNPWFPVIAELDEALGDRIVVDMHMPPGIELAWPPDVDR
ncbi:MAG: hypothetical protein R8J94_21490 [Acidimicrobiia bacterium]|nr:hypothetical protein [Acidimicrobiia bacterium]